MRIRQGLDAIEVVHVGAELRQRAQERAAVLARLHQHGVLIGQIAGQLVVVAHEFPARSIQRLQPFGHPPGAHTMHDAHGFDPAFAQMEERAIVISGRQRMVHLLQPLARIVRGPAELRDAREHNADDGAGNEPVRSTTQPSRHGVTRASRDCCRGASALARSPAAPSGSSASANKPDNTFSWPNTEEYLLWANT